MKENAEKERLLTQPGKMLISSRFLENGTIVTPLVLFYLDLGLLWKANYRFLQYTPMKCFNNFVQSPVTATREEDENPSSSYGVETLKLLPNSLHGYQIMDQSRHTVNKKSQWWKTHGAINNKIFKRLCYKNDQLFEVELVKSEFERKEPIMVGFSIPQYAKLRMLELYCNFFDKYCDVTKFGDVEMDTDLLYVALSEHSLYDCIRAAVKIVWSSLQSGECTNDFSTSSTTFFLPRTCWAKNEKQDRQGLGLFKEEFGCTEMISLCSKT